MTVQYSGLHSITLWKNDGQDKKDTWKDFHLIPIIRPYIEIASPNKIMINIPGTNKRIDITDHITNSTTYNKKEGDWEFIIVHDLWKDWTTSLKEISDFIHGETIVVSLNDDPEYFYSGILTIGDYTPEKEYTRVIIHYVLDCEAMVAPVKMYPIKFIKSDGTSYIPNYGIKQGFDYIESYLGSNNVMVAYELFVIDANQTGE